MDTTQFLKEDWAEVEQLKLRIEQDHQDYLDDQFEQQDIEFANWLHKEQNPDMGHK